MYGNKITVLATYYMYMYVCMCRMVYDVQEAPLHIQWYYYNYVHTLSNDWEKEHNHEYLDYMYIPRQKYNHKVECQFHVYGNEITVLTT
jgi:hypothetical protein